MGRKVYKIQKWASCSLGIFIFAFFSPDIHSSPIENNQERFEEVALQIWMQNLDI